VGLIPYDWCHKKKNRHGKTQTQEGHCVTREADIGVMQLQAKEHQGQRASTRSWEEARKSPPTATNSILLTPRFQISYLQNCENKFCC
jgi:hypothetical protein